MKTCRVCEEHKDESEFQAGRTMCKLCRLEQKRQWRKNNLEHNAKWMREYREKNKEQLLEWRNKHSEANRGRLSEYQKKWREQNAEYFKEYTRNYYTNRYKTDIQYKIRVVMRAELGRALCKFKKDELDVSSKLELIGCDLEYFKEWIEDQFDEGMSWENHGEWHLDHIKPLASFDLTDPEQIEEACIFFNFQPLWAEDNLKNSDRVLI
jgi:hypothetical protein